MKSWPGNLFVTASPSADSHGRTRCVHGHSLVIPIFKEGDLSDRSCCCRLQDDDGPEPEEEDEKSAEVEEQEQVASADGERWPRWLRPMMSARFYTPCKTHPDSRRGGVRAMFCLDCADVAGALCSLCADQGHRGHRVIRVRRST